MKKFKKITMGVALLAVIGGLAGCGKQASTHHSHSQQSAQKANNPEANEPEDMQVVDGMQNVWNEIPNWQQSKYTVSPSGQTEPYIMTFKVPDSQAKKLDNIQEHKDRQDPETVDGHDPEPLAHFNYTPQHDMQSWWKLFYSHMKKDGITKKKPVSILFHYEFDAPEHQPKYYIAYKAKSNSPKLQDMHMKQLKPYHTAGGNYELPNE